MRSKHIAIKCIVLPLKRASPGRRSKKAGKARLKFSNKCPKGNECIHTDRYLLVLDAMNKSSKGATRILYQR